MKIQYADSRQSGASGAVHTTKTRWGLIAGSHLPARWVQVNIPLNQSHYTSPADVCVVLPCYLPAFSNLKTPTHWTCKWESNSSCMCFILVASGCHCWNPASAISLFRMTHRITVSFLPSFFPLFFLWGLKAIGPKMSPLPDSLEPNSFKG